MSKVKLSVAEIIELAKNAKEQGIDPDLPSSKPGVIDRAERQEWEYELAPAKGGKSGMKKVYTLPEDVVSRLKDKGLLDSLKLGSNATEPVAPKPRRKQPESAVGVPDFMRPMVAEYDDWAAAQDTDAIVPVRYHVNVFGSAGNGYALDEPLATEAMWFRRSFFDYLGVPAAQCFCTRVKGDSMHPTLIDRGTVLWHMQNAYTSEGIYLFRQVNELRIKRLQCVNSYTFRIISDNSNKDIYPIELLDLRELADHEFEIYGRYLWDCAIHP